MTVLCLEWYACHERQERESRDKETPVDSRALEGQVLGHDGADLTRFDGRRVKRRHGVHGCAPHDDTPADARKA